MNQQNINFYSHKYCLWSSRKDGVKTLEKEKDWVEEKNSNNVYKKAQTHTHAHI